MYAFYDLKKYTVEYKNDIKESTCDESGFVRSKNGNPGYIGGVIGGTMNNCQR